MSKLQLDPPGQLAPPEMLRSFWFQFSTWINNFYERVGDGPFMVRGYAKANLPAAADWSDNSDFSALVYVTDEVGGATLAFSDGTNWRRVQDRAIVS